MILIDFFHHRIISGPPTIIEKNFGEQNWLVVSMDNSASMNRHIYNHTDVEGVNAPNSLYAVQYCGEERKVFYFKMCSSDSMPSYHGLEM